MKVSSRIDGVLFLQLLVDLRHFDLLGADVVDDLDALPLLHVVGDELADHAVGEGVVLDVDPEVVEEVRVPQTMEVVEDGLLARIVVRDPDALGRPARFQLDVIQVGLRVDERRAALRLEAGRDQVDDRARTGGRERARGWHLLTADQLRVPLRRRSRSRGRLLGLRRRRPPSHTKSAAHTQKHFDMKFEFFTLLDLRRGGETGGRVEIRNLGI